MDVADDAHRAEAQQQGEDGGREEAGVLGEPQQEPRLDTDGEQGMSAGIDKTNTRVTDPLTRPTTKAATIASL